MGRFDEADRLMERAPDGYAVQNVTAERLLRQGRNEQVIRLLEPEISHGIPAGDVRRASLGCAYAALRRKAGLPDSSTSGAGGDTAF